MGKKLESLLDQDGDLDKWETNSITDSDRRVLITRWVVNAVEPSIDTWPGYHLHFFLEDEVGYND